MAMRTLFNLSCLPSSVAVETDYAQREYGVDGDDLARFVKLVRGKIEKERKAGTLREFTGDIEALVRES